MSSGCRRVRIRGELGLSTPLVAKGSLEVEGEACSRHELETLVDDFIYAAGRATGTILRTILKRNMLSGIRLLKRVGRFFDSLLK